MSLCVREVKQRKWSYGSPLVSIFEGEETDCEDGTESDGAQRTANSANRGSVKVRKLGWHY